MAKNPVSEEETFRWLAGAWKIKPIWDRFKDRKPILLENAYQYAVPGIVVDTDYAMSDKVDLSEPVLFLRYVGLIDGNHRSYKASRLGCKSPVIVLDADEIKFAEVGDRKAHENLRDYLGKLKK